MSFNSDPALQVNQLPLSIDFPKDQDKFLQIWTDLYKRMANCINTKEGGLFTLQETFSSQQFFTPGTPNTFRNVYRECFDMVALNNGPIAPGATVSVPHGISGITSGTHIYGSATNSASPPMFLPLPYVSATSVTKQIEIEMTSTNVILVNGSTQTTLTQAYITCEYLKT